MFNRFEWKKTVTRTIEDLEKQFPVQNLIGKKITRLNAIGCIAPWDFENLGSTKQYCQIEVNEPFVFGFEDGSTFEIQFFEDDFCLFSENQLSVFDGAGINHQKVDANILFKEILNSRIKKIFFLEEIIFVMDNGYGLKMSNLSSNSGLIELEKEKKPVEKLGSELLASRRNNYITEIVMGPEYSETFIYESGNDENYSVGEVIGDDESIEINGKEIQLNMPELTDWVFEYLWQVLTPCESGEKSIEEINKTFNWQDFHKRGIELAHKVKNLLPENVRLRYESGFEDRSGIIKDDFWIE